jgi:hypothetical protein
MRTTDVPWVPNAETGRTVLADCLTALALGINEPVIDLVGHYPSPSVLVALRRAFSSTCRRDAA